MIAMVAQHDLRALPVEREPIPTVDSRLPHIFRALDTMGAEAVTGWIIAQPLYSFKNRTL